MNHTMHEIEPEEVMAYLDGELEASRASEVAAHIAGCAECRTVEADLRAVSLNLVQWQVEQAPASVAKCLEQAIARPSVRIKAPRSKGLFPAWHLLSATPWAWKFGLASVAVLLLGAVYLQRSGLERSRRNQEATGLSAPDSLTGDGQRAGNYMYSPAKPVPHSMTQTAHGGGAGGIVGGNADSNQSLYIPEPGLTLPADKSATGAVTEKEFGKLAKIQPGVAADGVPVTGPMIARTAEMNIVVKKLDDARAALEKLLARHHGFASAMSVDRSEAAPSLDATLQVPAAQLDDVLSELRAFGRVSTESQGGEDVSDQHVDLAARLHNARESEQRLLEILRTRTGKVSDILEVEEQVSSTREQIEQMEAQLANLGKRVSYASIKLQMGEDYKAPAQNRGVTLRLRNAIVGGYRDAVDSLLALAVFLLSAGPMLLLWAGLLFFPARAIWKRRGALRAAFGKNTA